MSGCLSAQGRAVLAVLLLADGEWVRVRELARRAGVGEQVRRLMPSLRRQLGSGVIEAHYPGRRSKGYRMTRLPPDECLDAVLAAVREIRRSEARWRAAS